MHQLWIAVAIGVAVGFLAKAAQSFLARVEAQRPGGACLPGVWGASGALPFGAAASAFTLGVFYQPRSAGDLLAWLLLVGAFAAPGLYCLAQAANWRLWVDPAGLQVRGPWRALRPIVRWSTVDQVKSNGTLGHMVFRLKSGRAQRIPYGVEGLLEALELARMHGARMDDRLLDEIRLARSGLDQSARGPDRQRPPR